MDTNSVDARVHVGRSPGRPWVRVTHGLHRTAACADLDAWQRLLPATAAFSHLTAAALHGWWLPELPTGHPVLVDQPLAASRSRRTGLRVTRTVHPVPVQRLDGLRVATPAHTLLACARDLGLLDLVVLVDCALRAGCTTEEVAAAAGGRQRGAPRLRRALGLADRRSESPWETALRLLHVCVGRQSSRSTSSGPTTAGSSPEGTSSSSGPGCCTSTTARCTGRPRPTRRTCDAIER